MKISDDKLGYVKVFSGDKLNYVEEFNGNPINIMKNCIAIADEKVYEIIEEYNKVTEEQQTLLDEQQALLDEQRDLFKKQATSIEKRQQLIEKHLEMLKKQKYREMEEENVKILKKQFKGIIYPEILLNVDYNNSFKTNLETQQRKKTKSKQETIVKINRKINENTINETLMKAFLDNYMPKMLFIISTYKNKENDLRNKTVIDEIENIIKDYIILNLINLCDIKHDKSGYKDMSTNIYQYENILLPSKNTASNVINETTNGITVTVSLRNRLSKSLHEQFEKLARSLNVNLFGKLEQQTFGNIFNDIFKICVSTQNQRIANSRNKVFQTINDKITEKKFALCLDDSDFIGFFNYNNGDGNFIQTLLEYELLSGELNIDKGLSFRFGVGNKGQQNYGGSIVSFWTKIFPVNSLKNFKNNVADVGEDGPTLYSYLANKENVSNNVIRLKNLYDIKDHPRKGYPVYIKYVDNMNPHYNAPIPINIKYILDGFTYNKFTTFDYLYTYKNKKELEEALQKIIKCEIEERKAAAERKNKNIKKCATKKTILTIRILPPSGYDITDCTTEKIFGYPLAKIISNAENADRDMSNGYNDKILRDLEEHMDEKEFFTFLNGKQIRKMKVKNMCNKQDLLENRNYLGTKIYELDLNKNKKDLLENRNYLGTKIYESDLDENEEDYHENLIEWVNKKFKDSYKSKKYMQLDYKKSNEKEVEEHNTKIDEYIKDKELLKKQTLSVYYLGSNDNVTFDSIEFIQRLMWNNYKEEKCGSIENYAFYGSDLMNTINNFFKKRWILSLLLISIMIIVIIIIIIIIKKRKITNKK